MRRAVRLAIAAALAAAFAIAAALPAAAAPPTAADATPRCPPPLPPAADDAGTPARDRGPLWRIARDGRVSHLYGTMHVGRPAWRRLGPRTDAALRASDVLAVEIDPSDPSLPDALADRRTVREPLAPALRERLERAYRRACIAPSSLAALHPLLQATTLAVLEAQWLGLGPAHAAERVLVERARTLGIGVAELETASVQVAALMPAGDPAAADTAIERSLRQLEDGRARRALARLAAAWEHGDLATLENPAAWCECVDDDADRALLRRLNDDRNPALVAAIAALHERGASVFAAVGVLHMTGERSLPRLLAARGYAVERLR